MLMPVTVSGNDRTNLRSGPNTLALISLGGEHLHRAIILINHEKATTCIPNNWRVDRTVDQLVITFPDSNDHFTLDSARPARCIAANHGWLSRHNYRREMNRT